MFIKIFNIGKPAGDKETGTINAEEVYVEGMFSRNTQLVQYDVFG